MIALRELLPFWLAGPEARLAADALEAFWGRPESWLNQALAQADIATCTAAALALHAADRSVERLPGEPESVWRQRILHALLVSLEGGSRRGLEAILAAFGLQNFALTERPGGQDWDIVLIDLDPTQLTLDSDSLNQVLYQWGRLCRRYAPTYTMSASAGVSASQDNGTFIFATATE